MSMAEQNTLEFVYYAHHKCASSWINRFLWNVTLSLGMRFFSYHSDDQADGDIAGEARRRKLEALTLRNARWDHVAGFEGVRGLHVIRDPRDVIVSGYFSHLKTHRLLDDPELAAEREMLGKLGKEEGLIASMKGINGRAIREMSEWRYGAAEGVMELRLEDMSGNSESSLRAILTHAGWLGGAPGPAQANGGPWRYVNYAWRRSRERTLVRRRFAALSEKEFQRILDVVSFERLSGGRKQGETDTSSHYRKGVHGDWVNHFTPGVEAAFKAEFPDVVSKLGYETGEEWSAREERFDHLRAD
jgi:hypothetical protein